MNQKPLFELGRSGPDAWTVPSRSTCSSKAPASRERPCVCQGSRAVATDRTACHKRRWTKVTLPLDELGHHHVADPRRWRSSNAEDLMTTGMSPPRPAQGLAGHDRDDIWKRSDPESGAGLLFRGWLALVFRVHRPYPERYRSNRAACAKHPVSGVCAAAACRFQRSVANVAPQVVKAQAAR